MEQARIPSVLLAVVAAAAIAAPETAKAQFSVSNLVTDDPTVHAAQITDPGQVEIEANDSKVLEVLTPESEHWRGLELDPNHRLLIRRSLVRAQVGEPIKSMKPALALADRQRLVN